MSKLAAVAAPAKNLEIGVKRKKQEEEGEEEDEEMDEQMPSQQNTEDVLNEEEEEMHKPQLLLHFDPVALKYIGRRVEPCIQCKYTKLGEQFNMSFKLVKSDSKLVKAILFAYGFLQCSNRNQRCNLLWTNTHLSANTMRQLGQWQRVNHFPRSWMLTRKDLLYENVDRAAIQYGQSWFSFIPDFFCTPLGADSAQKLRQCLLEVERGHAPPFIVKPVGGSFGRGIFFLDKSEQISTLLANKEAEERLLVSRYIERPFLINGLKWDLRIYVLVTSFYPLMAYVYSEGLARFAVHKYYTADEGNAKDASDAKNLSDLNRHLTNYSLNKSSEQFVRNTDCTRENQGHKWTLGALLRELEGRAGAGIGAVQPVDTGLLMVRIEDIVVKALLAIQPKVAAMCRKLNLHPKCCFELFGFDILVDEDMKPWLLELNLSPSLTCDSPLDSLLKSHLLCNVLNIAQVPLVLDRNGQNQCHAENEEEAEQHSAGEQQQTEADNGTAGSATCSSSTTKTTSSSSSSAASGSVTRQRAPPVSAGKVRKMPSQQQKPAQKISYSADRITPQYLERLNCLHEKFRAEQRQLGHFNRIFPRPTSLAMYGSVLEDSGQERWDEALHRRLMDCEWGGGGQRGAVDEPRGQDGHGAGDEPAHERELAMRDIHMAHEQLMEAGKYKHRQQLDPVVRDVVLAEALRSAECYRRRLYVGELQPYPSALPKIRPGARRRTRSQCEAEETRKRKMEERRAQGDEATTAGASGSAASSSPPSTTTTAAAAPLAEMSLNKMDMDGEREQQQQQEKKQKQLMKESEKNGTGLLGGMKRQ